jgi:hypothetical protein
MAKLGNIPWSRIEDAFRLFAFHTRYTKTYADELDNTVRFAKALVASMEPIADKGLVELWYRDWARLRATRFKKEKH